MSKSKSKPILFNGEMVRAILDGRKTQTRRVWRKPKRHAFNDVRPVRAAGRFELSSGGFCIGEMIHCPYGQAGDTLWVRETWATPGNYDHIKPSELMAGDFASSSTVYRATAEHGDVYYKWRPSIYMPRWASRITLRVKSVRVERVQEIGEEDARAEGVTPMTWISHPENEPAYRVMFQPLWDSINAKRGFGWDVNPFVWVVEFEGLANE